MACWHFTRASAGWVVPPLGAPVDRLEVDGVVEVGVVNGVAGVEVEVVDAVEVVDGVTVTVVGAVTVTVVPGVPEAVTVAVVVPVAVTVAVTVRVSGAVIDAAVEVPLLPELAVWTTADAVLVVDAGFNAR
jgi:hypothetical protein